ncbi:MAG TPA: MFS transporter [Pirellulales bacterium]|nr:MFS transporter [Pirellulales bacterium]
MIVPEASSIDRATTVRYRIVFIATLSAVLLYADRNCVSFAARYIGDDLGLDPTQVGWLLSAFFWSYALAQVPAGWVGDRFGARGTMVVYMLCWSLLTAALGLANGFAGLFALRLACGLAQAGAYPICSALVGRWMPLSARGLASSIVSLGGRLGGAMVPTTTAYLLDMLNWRGVMLIYGLIGLPVAWWFARWVTSSPHEHRRCNPAERAMLATPVPTAGQRRAATSIPWSTFLRDASLWSMSIAQFGTNVGWAFLVTWLPDYLEQAHQVPTDERGVMSSLPLLAGMVGGLIGGWLTDRATARWGVRWGRSLPMALSRFGAAAAFVACLWIDDPWLATAAFVVVSFMTDLGIGATWTFAQDVGGRNVGAVLGWGNMWGNLGAALSPVLLESVLGEDRTDWSRPFVVCAAAFAVAGVASLGFRADRPLAGRASRLPITA